MEYHNKCSTCISSFPSCPRLLSTLSISPKNTEKHKLPPLKPKLTIIRKWSVFVKMLREFDRRRLLSQLTSVCVLAREASHFIRSWQRLFHLVSSEVYSYVMLNVGHYCCPTYRDLYYACLNLVQWPPFVDSSKQHCCVQKRRSEQGLFCHVFIFSWTVASAADTGIFVQQINCGVETLLM